MGQEFVGDAADRLRLDIADGARPFGRIAAHMANEVVKRRADLHGMVLDDLVVGTELDTTEREDPVEGRIDSRRVESNGATTGLVDDQRLVLVPIAEEKALRTDQIGRRRVMLQELDV